MSDQNIAKLNALDLRSVQWSQERLVRRQCPLCKNSNSSSVCIRPDSLEVSRCVVCGLYYVSHSPNHEDLAEFYQGYNNSYFQAEVSLRQHKIKVQYKSPIDYKHNISMLNKYLQLKDASVLDVGCGKGDFLYAMKVAGANVYGLDIDPSIVRFTSNLGLKNITIGGIDDIKFIDRFDLVSLNDVIEHPLELQCFLDAVFNNLRPGGLLSVITPNGDAFNDGIYTAARVDLEHMQYVTTSSIEYICKRWGCECIHLEKYGFPDESRIYAASSFFQSSLRVAKLIIFLLGLYPLIAAFRRKRMRLQDGNYHMFFVLRKK